MTTTVIRNADWVTAWDEAAGQHRYRRDIDIAFTDGTIAFVGRNYEGAADRVIDARDRLVLPGLIDIHAHPEHEPLYRGVREEHGVRSMHMTGLYERSQAFFAPDDDARGASAEFAYCELLPISSQGASIRHRQGPFARREAARGTPRPSRPT